MKFEVSERIATSADKEAILGELEEQLRKISHDVTRTCDTLTAKAVETSFGSINRSDTTIVSLKKTDDGFLLLANIHYQPSVAFWVILIVTLFTYVFWLIPIIFYMVQKQTVRTGIKIVFIRVKNEFTDSGGTQSKKINNQKLPNLDELEKLANLKEKGTITEEEFQTMKKELLGLLTQ